MPVVSAKFCFAKRVRRLSLRALIVAFCCCVVPLALAQKPAQPIAPVIWLAQVDSSSAARAVQRATGGKVLSVHRQERKGRVQYRVKVLLPEGRVRTMTVDGETGSVSG